MTVDPLSVSLNDKPTEIPMAEQIAPELLAALLAGDYILVKKDSLASLRCGEISYNADEVLEHIANDVLEFTGGHISKKQCQILVETVDFYRPNKPMSGEFPPAHDIDSRSELECKYNELRRLAYVD